MARFGSLAQTVAANWRDELIGAGQVQRRHWRTKVAHYEAVSQLLAEGRPLRWETVVATVRPRGSRSTFYDVTGAKATHPLISRYELERSTNSNGSQIALAYRRASAVEQLVDETKVWSFWSYRDSWLTAMTQRPSADPVELVDSLNDALSGWARRHPALARAVNCAPPACAVEDYTLIHGGDLPALRAFSTLRETVIDAVSGVAPTGPTQTAPVARDDPDQLLLGLAETVATLGHRLKVLSNA